MRISQTPHVVLVGPTAAGKSDVIHAMARWCNAGVISADAMMVYRGMDIGTAKPTKAERRGITYAGLDLADLSQIFSVFDYLHGVDKTLQQTSNVSSWMVAGGTGLYVRCLLKGLDEQDGADPQLRAEAENLLQDQGFDVLKAWCVQRDPHILDRLPEGDRGNPRRWIRAVERGERTVMDQEIPPTVRVIGLLRDRADLEQRIIQRVERMFDHGLMEEVATLRQSHAVWSNTAQHAIGYAEALAAIEGTLSLPAAKERTIIRTRQYAKRQMTWFRHQLPTHWITVKKNEKAEDTAANIMSWCKKYDGND